MASNNISKYYKVDNGLDLTSDSQFATLSANEKIVYKPSGEKYIKNSNYPNVFDKTDTFGELEEKVDTNITKLEEKVDTKVISKIDDANTSGVCSCKNSSGTQIDTFTCHVPVNNSAPTLNWGQTSTIGTVDGTPLTVKMPVNPNTDTKYSAGTGLSLNGTEFSISQEYFNNILRYDDRSNNYYRYRVEYKEKGEDIPPSAGGSGKTYPISGWYIIGYSRGSGYQSSYELISTPQEILDKINNGSGHYGNMWYVNSTSNGLKPSSSIYSDFMNQVSYGCGGPESAGSFLTGDHPPSGTYYCEIINTGVAGDDSSSISSCFIYITTP